MLVQYLASAPNNRKKISPTAQLSPRQNRTKQQRVAQATNIFGRGVWVGPLARASPEERHKRYANSVPCISTKQQEEDFPTAQLSPRQNRTKQQRVARAITAQHWPYCTMLGITVLR